MSEKLCTSVLDNYNSHTNKYKPYPHKQREVKNG